MGCKNFEPSCALLNKLKTISAFRKSIDLTSKNKTVSDPLTLFDGDSLSFINRIIAKKGTEPFLDSTVLQQSFIQPFVKLYKVVYDSKGKKHELEFKFATNHTGTSIEGIFANRGALGRGIGLTRASVNYVGQNYEEADKLIEVDLSFFAESVKDIFAPPIAPDAARFSDLITMPVSAKVKPPMIKNSVSCGLVPGSNLRMPHLYHLKMVYGWAIPRRNIKEFPPEMKRAIENCSVTMSMTLYNYTLKFNEQGTLNITAQYMASLMTDLDQLNTDVFGLEAKMKEYSKDLKAGVAAGLVSKQVADAIKDIRDKFIKQSLQDNALGLSAEAKQSLKSGNLDAAGVTGSSLENKISVVLEQDLGMHLQKENLESIIKNLEDKGSIYFWDITKDDIQEYNKLTCASQEETFLEMLKEQYLNQDPPPGDALEASKADMTQSFRSGNSTGIAESIKKHLESELNSLGPVFQKGAFSNEAIELDSTDGKARSVPVVFLCDLVDSVLQNIQGSYSYKEHNYRIILGPMEITDPYTKKRFNINIGDMPIVLSDFATWYRRHVVAQGLQTLPFNEFMKSIIKNLVIDSFLNRCNVEMNNVIGNSRFEIGYAQLAVAGVGRKGKDPLSDIDGNRIDTEMFRGTIYGPNLFVDPKNKKPSKMYNYLFYYATNQSSNSFLGDPMTDVKKGVHHLTLGKDRGLVKKIDFQIVQNEKLKMYLMFSRSSPLAQLRLPFNASVSMIGNNYFLPGSYVYINPSIAGLGDPRNPASHANRIGLGGYYIVVGVRHTLELDSGKYETALETMHIAWPQNCTKAASVKVTHDLAAYERGEARLDSTARSSDGEMLPDDQTSRAIVDRALEQRQKELQRDAATPDDVRWVITPWGVPYPVTRDASIPDELLGVAPGEQTSFDSFEDWQERGVSQDHMSTSFEIEGNDGPVDNSWYVPNLPPPPAIPRRYRARAESYSDMPPKIPHSANRVIAEQVITFLEATRPRPGASVLPYDLDNLLLLNGVRLESKSAIVSSSSDVVTIGVFTMEEVTTRDVNMAMHDNWAGDEREARTYDTKRVYTFYCYKNEVWGWFIYYDTSGGGRATSFSQSYEQ